MSAPVEKRIWLSPERAQQLSDVAQAHQVSEDQIIDQALDIIFTLADFLDAPIQRSGRLSRSEVASQSSVKNSENSNAQAPSEEEFKQRLREMGLLAPAKTPPPTEPATDRTPIQVKGKPISEMIIEERR